MKWISNFLRRPAPQPPSPAVPQQPGAAAPTADLAALRSQFAGAESGPLRERLAGRLGQALAEAGQPPRADDDPAVRVAAICHAHDKALALAWLADLDDQASLGTVALQARGGEVRYAAVLRVDAEAVLERVVQASRDKDKRVHRHCADRLRQRRDAQASARRAAAIADQLRALLDTAPQSLSRLMELKKSVSELAPDAAQAECAALLDAAFTRLRQETEAQRRLHALQESARQLDADCVQAHWPWSACLPEWRARLDVLQQDAAGQPAWLAAPAQALATTLAGIGSRLAEMAGEDARAAECEAFLAALEREPPGEADARARWQSLARPRHAEARQALEARWNALHAGLYPAQAVAAEPTPAATTETRARPAPKLDHAALGDLLDQLERAIGAGHLADGDAAARRIKSLIAGTTLRGALESRWHALQAELETLRGWARWGTQQAREKLIAEAEALSVGEPTVDRLAEAIPAMREAWKRLDTHGPAGKAQWESFDAALEKAYAPVAAQRAEQAARQAEARAFKEDLCARWEADDAWRQADFKSVEARRADLIQQWRAAPQAGFRDERALRKRFDALIEALDRHLDAARAAERARREQIIQAAEALAAETDTRRAIAAAKALQQSWSKDGASVRLKRGDDQKLWQRFRAACDAVFARLDAQRAEQATERARQAEARRHLLDEFAAALAGSDVQSIRQAMARFQSDWDAGRPSGRDRGGERGDEAQERQEQQARALLDQARQRIEALRQNRLQARYDLLAHKSALAERIETAVLADKPIEALLAEVKDAWSALPDLPGKSERLLAGRLAGASAITPAAMKAGRETRESLLLDLEIALGIASPDHCAEMRRERQLARLQDRFGQAAQETEAPDDMLARWHATPGASDPESAARVATVIRQLTGRAAASRPARGTQPRAPASLT